MKFTIKNGIVVLFIFFTFFEGFQVSAEKGDNEKALLFYKEAAKLGKKNAMNNIAIIYSVEYKDYLNAIPWYEKLYAKGQVSAAGKLQVIACGELNVFRF